MAILIISPSRLKDPFDKKGRVEKKKWRGKERGKRKRKTKKKVQF